MTIEQWLETEGGPGRYLPADLSSPEFLRKWFYADKNNNLDYRQKYLEKSKELDDYKKAIVEILGTDQLYEINRTVESLRGKDKLRQEQWIIQMNNLEVSHANLKLELQNSKNDLNKLLSQNSLLEQ